ncbi:helix-turn-helix domain-containing protein [Amycolatopsis pigmentata]|uniref:Helix-turn-helix domain-containing protein n=1 Tax=Amycolatopsis pigmentata TaxID=450801 RepID=A0ABW5G3U2_9PSEU
MVSAPPILFGAKLRELRLAAGLSLNDLAALVHYSKGYLSKIETGQKQPTDDIARRCDAALGTSGDLVTLLPGKPQHGPAGETSVDGEGWTMTLVPGGASWFQPMDRRQALASGTASMLTFGISAGNTQTASTVPIDVFRAMFDHFRRLGQSMSPAVVLPALVTHTHTLRELARNARPGERGEVLTLCARYAEYAGWMAQESGNDHAALWWTDRAVEMAEAGGDREMATYAVVRRALVAFYRGDAHDTIELAKQAQNPNSSHRIRGLAAQREAQGHALAGDYDQCMRGLDRARALLAAATNESTLPPLGPTNVADPVAMTEGWSLHDLGRPHEAASILDREMDRIPGHAVRSRARYGVRQALAHAASGEVEHACVLTARILDLVDAADSVTVNTDLQRLARTLARFHTSSAVKAIQPRLVTSLHRPST